MLKRAEKWPVLLLWLISFVGVALLPLIRWVDFLITGQVTHEVPMLAMGLIIVTGIVFILLSTLAVFKARVWGAIPFSVFLFSGLTALCLAFYSDVSLLFLLIKRDVIVEGNFSAQIQVYLQQVSMHYVLAIGCWAISLMIRLIKPLENTTPEKTRQWLPLGGILCVMLYPLLLSCPLPIINTFLLHTVPGFEWAPISPQFMAFLNALSVMLILGFIAWAYRMRITLNIARFAWLKWFNGAAISLGAILFCNVMSCLWVVMGFSQLGRVHAEIGFQVLWSEHQALWFPLIPVVIAFIGVSLFTLRLKKKLFDETDKAEETSGYFGSAVFAKQKEYESLNLYQAEGQIPIGMDENNRLLYLPLDQKMTLAPKGTGKSACSSIPALLTYNGPVVVLDVKGELWATTARYRHEVMKRHVVVIDPFGVTRSADFVKGKPEALLKEYHFNPFDWLPEEGEHRDRILNTFAASFIVDEKGAIKHFDENAKILIRGYMDYMMTLPKVSRHLSKLYQLMSESIDDATQTFEQMALCGGRAGAAANQIMRVGSDERGSILSTSYRQIDWIGDRNLSKLLSESNFDLKDFLKGNMDIFVVLPPDQVKEHSRLMRMLIALLLGLLVQSNPSDLPKQKILILLDEIAQLGYCPDVEECIEVLRAWGVVVWSVFQTLSQVELFEKPDLFKGSTFKQIFTNDDTKTMEWIQTLGCKKTVVTKTVSTNKGQSKQVSQMFSTNKSSGEGESVQETGVDLIPLNEISGLPFEEQFIFTAGKKPIRCKKARYFEHPFFAGKFDQNPLEQRHAA